MGTQGNSRNSGELKNRFLFALPFVLCVGLLLTTSCNLRPEQAASNQFECAKFGLTFSYPANWHISEDFGSMRILHVPDQEVDEGGYMYISQARQISEEEGDLLNLLETVKNRRLVSSGSMGATVLEEPHFVANDGQEIARMTFRYLANGFPTRSETADRQGVLTVETVWVIQVGEYIVIVTADTPAETEDEFRPLFDDVVASIEVSEPVAPGVNIPEGFILKESIYHLYYLYPENWHLLEDNFWIDMHPNETVPMYEDEMSITIDGAHTMFMRSFKLEPPVPDLLSFFNNPYNLPQEELVEAEPVEYISPPELITINGREVLIATKEEEGHIHLSGAVSTCSRMVLVSGKSQLELATEFRPLFETVLSSIQ